jgi:hypothetical protein
MSTYLYCDEVEALSEALRDHRDNIRYLWTLTPGSSAFDTYAIQTGYSVARTALGEEAPIERVYALRAELVADWKVAARQPERYGITR